MPLTFAHPAAILPLASLATRAGRRLPTAALVVGSMAPDLLYFLRMQAHGRFGHTLPGLFLFCLPVGLAVLWVVDRVLREPIAGLAPDGLRERLAARPLTPLWSPSAIGWTALAVVLGAMTHNLWDAFTHRSTWATRAFSVLRHEVTLGPLGEVAVYKIGQHVSTFLGLAVLAVAFSSWWRRAPRAPVSLGLPTVSRALRLGTMLAVGAAAGLARGVWRYGLFHSVADFIGTTIVVSTAVAFWLAVVYGLATRRPRRHHAQRDA